MFNKDFYPTPENIIFKMSQAIGGLHTKGSTLEPNVGSCAIIDYIQSVCRNKKVYAFEKDIELQAIVKSRKDVVFLGDDFLAYIGSQRFDKVFMNPPFSEGDKHALKAWEVLESEGRMVCLLNAETILNPYTKTRQMLLELVQNFGSYEMLGKCFAKGAPRTTDVDVVMIVLQKPKEDKSRFDFSSAGFQSAEKVAFDKDFHINSPATQNAITNVVAHYKGAENALIDAIQAVDKLAYHLDVFGAGRSSQTIENVMKFITNTIYAEKNEMTKAKNEAFNNASELMKAKAWGYIDTRTNVGEHLTNEARKQFEAYMEAQKGVDFSETNIMKLFEYLSLNRDFLMQKAIEQTFEMMCKFHDKNKVSDDSWKKENKDGFKTNSHYKVNPKVIIPYMVDWNWSYPKIKWEDQKKTDEIDKVLCHLFGLELKKVVTIQQAVDLVSPERKKQAINDARLKGWDFEESYNKRLAFNPSSFEGVKMIGEQDANNDSKLWKNATVSRARGNVAESTFFWCEYFIKGTLHLYFKHRVVWETFNRVACEGKKEIG
jgi:predicted RNA methylase